MSRRVFAMGLLVSTLAWGAEPAVTAESAWAALGAAKTVSARFTQTQHRAILREPLVSTGRLAFARPGQLRWQVETPTPSIFVLDRERIGLAYPELGVTQTMSLEDQPEAKRLVQGMFVWLAADRAAIERDYDLSIEGPRVVLKPKTPALQSMLARIELTLEGGAVRHVALVEPDDERVDIEFDDLRTNEPIARETFSLPTAE